MAESPETAARCVHCLRFTDTVTGDHVFPHSWYPDSTPPTVQRWTVPCCQECNKRLGQLETDLLAWLALCLDPSSEAAAGLSSKVLRSLGIDAEGISDREKEHRQKRRAKIKGEFLDGADMTATGGAIPGLSRQQSVGEAGQYAIPIPWAGLSIIAEKIARGCEFKLKDRYVESPYAVRTCVTEPDEISPLFQSHRRLVDFGPGCQVLRVFATEDPNVVRYRILVWGTLCFHVLFDTEEYFSTNFDPKMKAVQGIAPGEGRKLMAVPAYLRELK